MLMWKIEFFFDKGQGFSIYRVCMNLTGEYEKGVDHLTNAIAVCGQPQQLLQVLQQTLPPPVFQMLLTKLPTISQRIVSGLKTCQKETPKSISVRIFCDHVYFGSCGAPVPRSRNPSSEWRYFQFLF